MHNEGHNVSSEAKYQIFISSTYTDLKKERQHVIREVIRAEQFPIAMENFVASDKNQWGTIERFLKCSGCLILLLGERYGTIDINDSKKRSFTEKEFDLAVELKIPILAFIQSGHQVQNNFAENEQYKEFKKKIEENRLVCYFRDGAELSGAVAHSIAIEKNSFINPWYMINNEEDVSNEEKVELSLLPNANHWGDDALEMFAKYKEDLEKLHYQWEKAEEWMGGKGFNYLFEVRSDRGTISKDMQQKGITKSFRYVYTDETGMKWVKGWYV